MCQLVQYSHDFKMILVCLCHASPLLANPLASCFTCSPIFTLKSVWIVKITMFCHQVSPRSMTAMIFACARAMVPCLVQQSFQHSRGHEPPLRPLKNENSCRVGNPSQKATSSVLRCLELAGKPPLKFKVRDAFRIV